MKMRHTAWTPFLALLLCASAGFAQDQKQDAPVDFSTPIQPLNASPSPSPNTNPSEGNSNPPIGAIRGVEEPFDPQPYDPSQVSPDTNTLAGAAPITLGSLQHSTNIFDPAISISQLGQSVPVKSGQTVLTGVSLVSGSVNFNRVWSEYHFSTIYNGGETFNLGYGAASSYFGTTSPHYQFHNLTITQEADWGRWRVVFRDIFVASPGAEFSGQGIGGPGLAAQYSSLLGSALNSVGQLFQPSESINTAQAMRYQNSILGEAEYSFSRRSAFTFSGSYGVLDFTNAGYFNSTMFDAQAGYDYLLDPSNSIAILGSYGRIDYSGTGTAATGTTTVGTGEYTTDFVGALAYGRKITGRLAFQVAAGPQEIYLNGAKGVGNAHLLFASVNSALTYQRRRSGLSFNYVRGLSAGSGVLLGATTNTFSGSAHYQFTRNWTGTVNGGYALNNSLGSTAVVSSTQFNNWFIGGNLGRQVGQHARFNFNYGVLDQISPPNCPPAICGGAGLEQTFGMSVNWHLRRMGLE